MGTERDGLAIGYTRLRGLYIYIESTFSLNSGRVKRDAILGEVWDGGANTRDGLDKAPTTMTWGRGSGWRDKP